MTEAMAPSGWYDDPKGEAELRWWDGQAWSEHTAARPATPVTAATPAATHAAAAATRLAAGAGAGGWQVVVGPTLPTFPAIGAIAVRRGAGRLLGNPAVLLAVTTLLGVLPALLTDTTGADTLAPARLGTGLAAAAGVAVAPRLRGRAQLVPKLLPLVFVALQVVAMASTLSSYRDDESGVGAALPHLLAGLVTVVAASRTALALRRVRSR